MYYNKLEANWKYQINQETINLQYKIVKLSHPKHSRKITKLSNVLKKQCHETIVSRQHITSLT